MEASRQLDTTQFWRVQHTRRKSEERTTSGGGKIFADSLSGFQDPKLEPSSAGVRLKF